MNNKQTIFITVAGDDARNGMHRVGDSVTKPFGRN